MAQTPSAQGTIGQTEAANVRSCLAKILSNPIFAQAERQQRFLRYLVEQTLAGQGDRLKGYNIGAEVFDRDADFDPRLDAIVRVEATRLRSKLREYYDGDGSNDAIRIEIPKGSYCALFSLRVAAGEDRALPESPAAPGTQATADAARAFVPAVSVPTDKPSLAVLPFANLSSDIEQEYFAAGITEDLITALSKLSGLFVIARQSAFVYKGVAKDVRDIARELGVRYLLEGSVRRSGNRVRITAQLVEADSGMQIWAERYDRDLEDIFAVQDDVTRRIVESLEVSLTDAESDNLVHAGTVSVEAHDLLLRGLERYWEYTRESVEAAQAFFAKALDLDPDYATAHAWLARSYIYRYSTDFAGEEAIELAFRHALRAVELNPRVPLTHSILGWTQMWRGRVTEAIGAARRAVAMDPNNADAHLFLSVILTSAGRGEEGLRIIQKGMRLNPHPTAFYLFALGHCYFALEQYEQAIPVFKAGIEMSPGFVPNREFFVVTHGLLGRIDEVTAERDSLLKLYKSGVSPIRWKSFWLDKRLDERAERGRRAAGLPLRT